MFSNFVFVPNKNVSCKRCITSINIHAHFVAVGYHLCCDVCLKKDSVSH